MRALYTADTPHSALLVAQGLTHTSATPTTRSTSSGAQLHVISPLLQLDPTSALLPPNVKKGRLNELKWTHFQSLQLDTAAFTIFHAVLFNVGGRSPFSTETFAFPFSQCLVFPTSSVLHASGKLWLPHKRPNSEGHQISDFSRAVVSYRSPEGLPFENTTAKPFQSLPALPFAVTGLKADLGDDRDSSPQQNNSLSSNRRLKSRQESRPAVGGGRRVSSTQTLPGGVQELLFEMETTECEGKETPG